MSNTAHFDIRDGDGVVYQNAHFAGFDPMAEFTLE